MSENTYQLIIRLPIKALDDAEARSEAKSELVNLGIEEKEMQYVKLQRLVDGKAPEGIPL